MSASRAVADQVRARLSGVSLPEESTWSVSTRGPEFAVLGASSGSERITVSVDPARVAALGIEAGQLKAALRGGAKDLEGLAALAVTKTPATVRLSDVASIQAESLGTLGYRAGDSVSIAWDGPAREVEVLPPGLEVLGPFDCTTTPKAVLLEVEPADPDLARDLSTRLGPDAVVAIDGGSMRVILPDDAAAREAASRIAELPGASMVGVRGVLGQRLELRHAEPRPSPEVLARRDGLRVVEVVLFGPAVHEATDAVLAAVPQAQRVEP